MAENAERTQLELWKNEHRTPRLAERDTPLAAAGRMFAEQHEGLHLVTSASKKHYCAQMGAAQHSSVEVKETWRDMPRRLWSRLTQSWRA